MFANGEKLLYVIFKRNIIKTFRFGHFQKQYLRKKYWPFFYKFSSWMMIMGFFKCSVVFHYK